jgi:protein-disulfide isomerase
VEDVLARNPEILAAAMERDPETFMEAFERTARRAALLRDERFQREEAARRDAELRAPLRPELDPARAYTGPDSAAITIVEYSDFECPYCRRGMATIDELFARYPGQVRLLYKHNASSPAHPHAKLAARYYEAVALQDDALARTFKRRLFDGQETLSARGESYLREQAAAVGADTVRVRRDLESAVVTARLAADSAEVERFGFEATPAYLINGVSVRGAYPLDHFVALIERLPAGR